jgi:glutaminyl-tRNA synthetase
VENVRGLKSRPVQREFARLNLTYTVMSKRKLLHLVNERRVDGWDDPRMPTLSGLRRRGFPPAAIRSFCSDLGITKYESLTDVSVLEATVRAELNRAAPRRMAVLRPLRVVLTNLPPDHLAMVELPNNPEDPETGTRAVPFTPELFIEHDDFDETPPPGYFRLSPGAEVRLRGAYVIRCQAVRRSSDGTPEVLECAADLDTLGKNPADGRRVKGVIHWVSAPEAIPATVKLYDRLFAAEDTGAAGERLGYFTPDSRDHDPPHHLVFNRTVPLRDSWAKASAKATS